MNFTNNNLVDSFFNYYFPIPGVASSDFFSEMACGASRPLLLHSLWLPREPFPTPRHGKGPVPEVCRLRV